MVAGGFCDGAAAARFAAGSAVGGHAGEVPEWSNDDAEVLKSFLGSPVGSRLRARLWDSAITASMDVLHGTDFQRGEARGLERTLRLIEEHAVKRDGDE